MTFQDDSSDEEVDIPITLEICIAVTEVSALIYEENYVNFVKNIIRQIMPQDIKPTKYGDLVYSIRELEINSIEELYAVQSKYQKDVKELLIKERKGHLYESYVDKVNNETFSVWGKCVERFCHKPIRDDIGEVVFNTSHRDNNSTTSYDSNGVRINITGRIDGYTPTKSGDIDTIIEIKNTEFKNYRTEVFQPHRMQVLGYMWLHNRYKSFVYEFFDGKYKKFLVTRDDKDWFNLLNIAESLITIAREWCETDVDKFLYSSKQSAMISIKLKKLEKLKK